MTPEQLKEKVDKIISQGGDPEAAHSDEDELHQELIREFAPKWVVEEIDRLDDADFPRWCA